MCCHLNLNLSAKVITKNCARLVDSQHHIYYSFEDIDHARLGRLEQIFCGRLELPRLM